MLPFYISPYFTSYFVVSVFFQYYPLRFSSIVSFRLHFPSCILSLTTLFVSCCHVLPITKGGTILSVKLMPEASSRVARNSQFKPKDYRRSGVRIRPDLWDLLVQLDSRVGLNITKQFNHALEYSGCPVDSSNSSTGRAD